MKNKISGPMIVILGINVTYAASINGLWQQVDDKSGQVHSLVRIETNANETFATLIKGYALPGKPLEANPVCQLCPGDFKDKPLKDLRFMWGLKQNGNEWDQGQILDPDEAQIYNVKLKPSEDGSKLEVHGYIGISLFGRTQIWRRFNGTAD